MAIVLGKQPEIRFDAAGPFGLEGKTFLPKMVTFKAEDISDSGYSDFFVAPAECFIPFAFIRVDDTLTTTDCVKLGTDSTADALINTTAFNSATIGNWASTLTDSRTYAGLYLHSGDTIRLTIVSHPTAHGGVSGFIVVYELPQVFEDGVHCEIVI